MYRQRRLHRSLGPTHRQLIRWLRSPHSQSQQKKNMTNSSPQSPPPAPPWKDRWMVLTVSTQTFRPSASCLLMSTASSIDLLVDLKEIQSGSPQVAFPCCGRLKDYILCLSVLIVIITPSSCGVCGIFSLPWFLLTPSLLHVNTFPGSFYQLPFVVPFQMWAQQWTAAMQIIISQRKMSPEHESVATARPLRVGTTTTQFRVFRTTNEPSKFLCPMKDQCTFPFVTQGLRVWSARGHFSLVPPSSRFYSYTANSPTFVFGPHGMQLQRQKFHSQVYSCPPPALSPADWAPGLMLKFEPPF